MPVTRSRPSAAPSLVPLTTMRVGCVATLCEVRDDACRGVLRSLGLTDHCQMRLCKVGDPCIVQVQATRIGLSRVVAEHLLVAPDPATGS